MSDQLAVFNTVMRDVRAVLAEKIVSATSPDGSVTVTVDGNGDFKSIGLARGVVRGMAAEELGAMLRDTAISTMSAMDKAGNDIWVAGKVLPEVVPPSGAVRDLGLKPNVGVG